MAENALLQVGLLCFPRLTPLDLMGPYEVLVRMPDTKTHILWKDTAPVRTAPGLRIVPDLTMADSPRLDVLVVPGGPGTDDLMEDEKVLEFLAIQGATARYIVSVCTGSLLLGAAGLLRGYRATCHWLFLSLLDPLGAYPTAERVVVDRNRVTGAGVSAGIDCALQLASPFRGEEAAQAIQLQTEYDPQPPFNCGSPKKAPDWLVQKLTKTTTAAIYSGRTLVVRDTKALTEAPMLTPKRPLRLQL